MPGIIPDVLIEIDRAAKLKRFWSVRSWMAFFTFLQLRKGSPIPMKTMLLIVGVGSFWSGLFSGFGVLVVLLVCCWLRKCFRKRICPVISSDVRSRVKPLAPVAQNLHPRVQPICDERQAVQLFVEFFIKTVSISELSVVSRMAFIDFLSFDIKTSLVWNGMIVKLFDNWSRRSFGRLFILSKESQSFLKIALMICLNRKFGWLLLSRNSFSFFVFMILV